MPARATSSLPLVQFARPGRDALQVIRSNHDPVDRPSPTIRDIPMLRRNNRLPRRLPGQTQACGS